MASSSHISRVIFQTAPLSKIQPSKQLLENQNRYWASCLSLAKPQCSLAAMLLLLLRWRENKDCIYLPKEGGRYIRQREGLTDIFSVKDVYLTLTTSQMGKQMPSAKPSPHTLPRLSFSTSHTSAVDSDIFRESLSQMDASHLCS